MRRYETIVIVRPNAGEDSIDIILDKTKEIIETNGGSMVNVDKWGLKKLGYLIKKEQQGYYVLMEYAARPEALVEMERVYRIDDRILKFMTVKIQDIYMPDATKEEETKEETDEEHTEETVEEIVKVEEETPLVKNNEADDVTVVEEKKIVE